MSLTLFSAGGVEPPIRRHPRQRHAASSGRSIVATLSSNDAGLAVTLRAACRREPSADLYVTAPTARWCVRETGSPLPSTIAFSSLIAADGLRRHSGDGRIRRFLQPGLGLGELECRFGWRDPGGYSGFPAGSILYVPDVVAGSDAVQSTSGGGFGGLAISGGSARLPPEAPCCSRALRARMRAARADRPCMCLVESALRPVTLDSVTQIPVVNGSGVRGV